MILAVSFIRYNPELSITNFRALLCTSQLLFFYYYYFFEAFSRVI